MEYARAWAVLRISCACVSSISWFQSISDSFLDKYINLLPSATMLRTLSLGRATDQPTS